MRNLLLTVFFLLITFSVLADGIEHLGVLLIFPVELVAVIALIAMVISSVYRFTSRPKRVNVVLNVSAFLLIILQSFCVYWIGWTNIDPGYLTVSLAAIGLALALIVFNNLPLRS
ncbi:MAG: hypothetical protein EP338_14410 [Bacteroidetes bacterium]|nr:MAG: hypothetical protein EP338_14410 [Bacteroidota bacterium]